jgi:hypothetical protein
VAAAGAHSTDSAEPPVAVGEGRRAAGGDGEAGEANGPLAREVWALCWPLAGAVLNGQCCWVLAGLA